jgi:geranylgeranyl pyrophosphate synthase
MAKTRVRTKDPMKQVLKIFRQRGAKALELAKKEILEEKIECAEVREALTYFMTQYWHDLARPSLLSLACEAIGGDPEITTHIAIPMTLISGAIDIHDDIIDQSKRKYGRRTVYGKYGKDIALLIGDALLFKGLTLLNRAVEKGIPAEKMRTIIDIIKNMFFELGDAEALELRFRGNLDIPPEEYLRVVHKKAADVEAHTRISGVVGSGSKEEIGALSKYGRLLGMLIILRDDWIDLMDFEEMYHRIKRESIPLPLIFSLQNQNRTKEIESILRKKEITRKDAKKVFEIACDKADQERFRNLLRGIDEKAFQELRKIKGPTRHLELLLSSIGRSIEENGRFKSTI